MYSLPFSLHLLYALVHSLSYVDQGEGDRVREQGNEAETAPLDGGNDSNYGSAEQRQGEAEMPLENELIWPPGRKLWPNWILQLINLLFLFVLRTVGWMAFPPSHNLYVTIYSLSFSPSSICHWHDSSRNIVGMYLLLWQLRSPSCWPVAKSSLLAEKTEENYHYKLI